MLIIELDDGVYILSIYFNLIVARVFLVSGLKNEPCHLPLNYGCLIKKSDT